MSKKKKKSKSAGSIRSHSEPISQNDQTVDAGRETEKQSSHAEIPVAAGLAPKSDLQPPKAHCQITCKTEKDWWDKAKPFVELAGVVLLAIYTGYTIKMYCANKEAADAARRSADTASEALVRSNRPWLAVYGDPQVLAPVQMGSDGAKLALQLSIKNFGISPALYVNLNRSLDTFLVPGNQRSTESDCQAAETETRNRNGPYIAPTAVLQRDIHLRNSSVNNFNQRFEVSGCIAYWDQFKQEIRHSSFCFISNFLIKDTRPNMSSFTTCPNQYAD